MDFFIESELSYEFPNKSVFIEPLFQKSHSILQGLKPGDEKFLKVNHGLVFHVRFVKFISFGEKMLKLVGKQEKIRTVIIGDSESNTFEVVEVENVVEHFGGNEEFWVLHSDFGFFEY